MLRAACDPPVVTLRDGLEDGACSAQIYLRLDAMHKQKAGIYVTVTRMPYYYDYDIYMVGCV